MSDLTARVAMAIDTAHANWCTQDQGSKEPLWSTLARASIEAVRTSPGCCPCGRWDMELAIDNALTNRATEAA